MANGFHHIFLHDSAQTSPYTTPSKGGHEARIPPRDRLDHATKLREELLLAWWEAEEMAQQRAAASLPSKEGTYLEFAGSPGFDLKTTSLEDRRRGVDIRLLNVSTDAAGEQPEAGLTRATVYVPEGRMQRYLDKIERYRSEDGKGGKPRNQALVDSIDGIRLAVLESFWRDDPRLVPDDEPAWCEVWLRTDGDETDGLFREIAAELDIGVGAGVLRFPERSVVLACASRPQLLELIDSSACIAEFRRAKEPAGFFGTLTNVEQTEWVRDLRQRLSVSEDPSVAVTVLDSGVNNGHLLLEPLLSDTDCHSVNPQWGTTDHVDGGHGTLVCGLAGYGDLQEALESSGEVEVHHCLESVKILPPHEANPPELYGHITIQGISRAEVQAPDRTHIGCMAVAASDGRDHGRPSSWSAAIDQLTSGQDDDERRLFLVAAGNTEDQVEWRAYPEGNRANSVHDPGQAWNALTVGAFTSKADLRHPDLAGHTPLAPVGGLSPYTTTSCTWESTLWPAKPDIVVEGGNVERAPDGFVSRHDDLSLLTTGPNPTSSQFGFIEATSAATAQAAWMAAQIQARYPAAWPETVRGLLVHSAQWTDTMKEQFVEDERKKGSYADLVRVCGYGVPSLDRAAACYRNSLTLVAQEYIQPFEKRGSDYVSKEMHLHELPWPRDVLLGLGAAEVTLRITLSYFVEPAPAEVGWGNRYRYASHALRFHLKNVDEDRDEFLRRINDAARGEDDEVSTTSGTQRWVIGPRGRNMGSIHSDMWHGTAADVATCNVIGVCPVIGWWRERPWLEMWNRRTRYSLIVSIQTPEQDVDIYTPVAAMLQVPTQVEVTRRT